ncbi:DUF2066 domain-containing protein [Marinobacter salinisoli]|uniref:DUF2066 domain-containing protein n=1 Tax=Marinobacter salinisoli TaxID=2769486 RepID=A0ABX7MSZ1_9GAMM|nr:DUF2066 domain-containing protein [Marinobacter salinisoli]QSP94226.1 DUF2066 domain-containing protein [Marinobacter salinisoli]
MSVSRSGPLSAYFRKLLTRVAVVSVLFAAFGLPASAVTVPGLYSVEVPVNGSSPQQLAVGYADGLAQVFVRVSGSRDVLEREGIEPLLANAESLLLSYQFFSNQDGGDRLQMSFGAVGVNQALASIDAPVWGANRPLTLAWVAVEDRGARTLLTNSSVSPDANPAMPAIAWRQAFEQAARDRGLPVALPPELYRGNRELMSDLWGQFIGRIQNASDSLDHDVIALVRVNRSGGAWRAGWVFEGMGLDAAEQSVTAQTPEALAREVVHRWADLYASRYAVSAADVGESPQVDLVLRGVNSLADYGAVTKVLQGLTPVTGVSATRLKEQQITLRVAFSGELDQLKEYIALDPRFVPLEQQEVVPALRAREKSAQTVGQGEAAQPQEGSASAGAPVEDAEPVEAEGASPVTYQPADIDVDEQDAEQAFESLYQVLYYRWQPGSVIGTGDAE